VIVAISDVCILYQPSELLKPVAGTPLLPTIPFELKELTPSVAGAAIGMILTFQDLGTFIYPIPSGKLIDRFTLNDYPHFSAQLLAFALTFLLVWRLAPGKGPGASKPESRRAPVRASAA
jgi:hypothetical protein